MAGKREAGWGKSKKYSDTSQRTDDLFFEFVRLLEGIQPKTFVAENVSGLVKGTAKGCFIEILTALKGAGYKVKVKILDAQWLGVPQCRQRAIFVGVRDGLDAEPAHPSPLPHRYTVRDAIPWISGNVNHVPGGRSGTRFSGAGDVTDVPCPTVLAGSQDRSRTDDFEVEPESSMTGFATGAEYDAMDGPGTQSGKYFQLVKASTGAPCPTVTAAGGNAGLASVCHPTQKRKFSIAELRRICAFPDDFVLTGSYSQQWERLGRAVPPIMMFRIARTVRDEVLLKLLRRKPWAFDPPCLIAGIKSAAKK